MNVNEMDVLLMPIVFVSSSFFFALIDVGIEILKTSILAGRRL